MSSPGGAQRNPGSADPPASLFPDCAALHPGYDASACLQLRWRSRNRCSGDLHRPPPRHCTPASDQTRSCRAGGASNRTHGVRRDRQRARLAARRCPAGDFIGTVCRRRPIVQGPNEDERGYPRTSHCLLAGRVERSRGPEPQVAFRDELFERIRLRHREANPSARREADRSHTVWIDEGLASQEDESPVGIRSAPDEGGKRA
jgi:hypothetical protein